MTDQIGTGTAQGVIDYLDSLVSKGRSRNGIVTPLKTALTKVLEKTEGEGKWTQTDVTSLDLDDTMTRFKNLTLGTYTEASYRAYYLRVQRALAWYKKFLENPGWAPQQQEKKQSSPNSKKETSRIHGEIAPQTQDSNPPSAEQESENTERISSTDNEMIAYPFPLTDGNIARLYLPKKINKIDAQRLSNFINALILDEEPRRGRDE